MRYALTLALTLAACFTAQTLALRAVGGRTTKSESNFFSSLGRIQAGAKGAPELMLLGSSITGRLPDRAQGFPGVANLASDGGSALDALRAMDRGLVPTAPVLVIEVNYLHRALDPTPSEVGRAMSQPWFQAGIRFQSISAYARPAAFFYSILLGRKIGTYDRAVDGDDLGVDSRPLPLAAPPRARLSTAERALVDQLRPLLQRLHQARCRTIFVWLPPGRVSGSDLPPWVATLVWESNSEWWDLGTDADPEQVTLTDGVHMSASTAARTMSSLAEGVLRSSEIRASYPEIPGGP
jgi:hypothetical protein